MTDNTTAPHPPQREEETKNKEKPRRTTGLRIFDVFLYPFLTNFVVFAISMAATYLTSHGADKSGSGKLIYGKAGEFFHSRGEWLVGRLQRLGLKRGQADMAKMVFFSFADGTLVAPFVKLFEDRREKLAKKIDDKLGTTPRDTSVYDAEPRQSWTSVITGRLATASIVVPTAVALDKTGLNDRLFSEPGRKAGEWIAHKPGIAKWFGKLDTPGLFKTVFFEAFYTSVCTAGLYFSSRLLATRLNKKKLPAHETMVHHDTSPEQATEEPAPRRLFATLVNQEASPAAGAGSDAMRSR